MTDSSPPATEPAKKASRAGRDLPAAITSGVVLVVAILASLIFWKPAFMVIVAVAVVVAIWELNRGFRARGINLPEEPLMIGGATMVVLAYFLGAAWLVTATAVTGLVIMLWLLRRGVDGYVRDATASMFALFYVPFLGSFFALLAAEDRGAVGVLSVIALTICSDTGGYIAGVLFGKHPMAPVISPKKSWEGFAGSVILSLVGGWALARFLLDAPLWVGLAMGLIGVVMSTLGDLCESVIKRDLGIKDMSQIIPGHGGLMDRLDSLLATVAPIWLLLHYVVFA